MIALQVRGKTCILIAEMLHFCVHLGNSNIFIYPYVYFLLSLHFIADLEQGCCVTRIYAGGDQSFAHYFTADVSFLK